MNVRQPPQGILRQVLRVACGVETTRQARDLDEGPQAVRSGLSRCSQGCKQGLKLFAALATQLQVFLDHRNRLRSVQAGELHLYEAVQLFEALIAADLYLTSVGYLLYYQVQGQFLRVEATSRLLQSEQASPNLPES
jgi:hypothetical protein